MKNGECKKNASNNLQDKTTKEYFEFKNASFNFKTHKWSLKKFIEHVKNESYKYSTPNYAVSDFENKVNTYFKKYPNKKGEVSTRKFIQTLKQSNNLDRFFDYKKKFKLKNNNDKIEFLYLMKQANKFTNNTDKKMIEHIHQYFDLGIKKSTLERIFRDN